MSILSIKLDTTDRNVVCEVADMLQRLIATEQSCKYKCDSQVGGFDMSTTTGQSAFEQDEFTFHGDSCTGNVTGFVSPADVMTPFEQSLGGVPVPPVRTVNDYAASMELTPEEADIVTGKDAIAAALGIPSLVVPTPPTLVPPNIVGLPSQQPPAPPVAPPRSTAKLDSEGLPWDRRIHASTKTFRQSDNTWKLIRGISEELITTVKAELRATMAAPAAPAPPVLTLVPPPAAVPTPPLPNMDDDKSWPAPPAGPAGVPVPPPPAPPAPPAADPFPDFVQFCTSNQQSGKLAYQVIVDTCGKYGITQLPMLNARHDLIPTIRAELEALCSK